MTFPEAFFVLGILVPGGVLARPAKHEHILPPVTVEVVGVGEEIVGIPVAAAELALVAGHFDFFAVLHHLEGGGIIVDSVALFEIRPRVPVRTHDHIALAVLVKISKVPTFRPEMRREMMLGPSVDFVVRSG